MSGSTGIPIPRSPTALVVIGGVACGALAYFSGLGAVGVLLIACVFGPIVVGFVLRTRQVALATLFNSLMYATAIGLALVLPDNRRWINWSDERLPVSLLVGAGMVVAAAQLARITARRTEHGEASGMNEPTE
jgi:hypothetical protein